MCSAYLTLGFKGRPPTPRPLWWYAMGHSPWPHAGRKQSTPDPKVPTLHEGACMSQRGALPVPTPGGCGVPALWLPDPNLGSKLLNPPCPSCSPFRSTQPLQHWLGLCGLTAGKRRLLHSQPPQSSFQVSDFFFPPRVAKQLMKKLFSFAFFL